MACSYHGSLVQKSCSGFVKPPKGGKSDELHLRLAVLSPLFGVLVGAPRLRSDLVFSLGSLGSSKVVVYPLVNRHSYGKLNISNS